MEKMSWLSPGSGFRQDPGFLERQQAPSLSRNGNIVGSIMIHPRIGVTPNMQINRRVPASSSIHSFFIYILTFTMAYMDYASPIYHRPPGITYCYPFSELTNLTDFQVKLADEFCDLTGTVQSTRYAVYETQSELRALTIASLVLNAVTVLLLLAFLGYSLHSHYKKSKQTIAL